MSPCSVETDVCAVASIARSLAMLSSCAARSVATISRSTSVSASSRERSPCSRTRSSCNRRTAGAMPSKVPVSGSRNRCAGSGEWARAAPATACAKKRVSHASQISAACGDSFRSRSASSASASASMLRVPRSGLFTMPSSASAKPRNSTHSNATGVRARHSRSKVRAWPCASMRMLPGMASTYSPGSRPSVAAASSVATGVAAARSRSSHRQRALQQRGDIAGLRMQQHRARQEATRKERRVREFLRKFPVVAAAGVQQPLADDDAVRRAGEGGRDLVARRTRAAVAPRQGVGVRTARRAFARAGDDQERVRVIDQQSIAHERVPRQGFAERTPRRSSIVAAGCARHEVGHVEPGGRERGVRQHHQRQLVVGKRQVELARCEPGPGDAAIEFAATEGDRTVRPIQSGDAEVGNAQMVFAAAVEILEPELVLDGDHQRAARADEPARARQQRLDAVARSIAKRVRVFEHADEKHPVRGGRIDRRDLVAHHADVAQVAAALARDRRAACAAFHGDDRRAGLAQPARERAASRAEFEHRVVRSDRQVSQQVGAHRRQVVLGRPVGDRGAQLVGEHGQIAGPPQRGQQRDFGRVTVGVGERRHAGAPQDAGRGVGLVARTEPLPDLGDAVLSRSHVHAVYRSALVHR